MKSYKSVSKKLLIGLILLIFIVVFIELQAIPISKELNDNKPTVNLLIEDKTLLDPGVTYYEVEVIGTVSLIGNIGKKLILRVEDSDLIYEFDKEQENYDLYVKEYQGYKVKINGKYYIRILKTNEGTEVERRYLIVGTIEIL